MTSQERIEQACRNVLATCKDAVKGNLIDATKNGTLSLTPCEINVLMNIVNRSFEQGKIVSQTKFMNDISDIDLERKID